MPGLGTRSIRSVRAAVRGARGRPAVLSVRTCHAFAGGGIRVIRGDPADASARLRVVRLLRGPARPQGRDDSRGRWRGDIDCAFRRLAYRCTGRPGRANPVPRAAAGAGRVRGRRGGVDAYHRHGIGRAEVSRRGVGADRRRRCGPGRVARFHRVPDHVVDLSGRALRRVGLALHVLHRHHQFGAWAVRVQ